MMGLIALLAAILFAAAKTSSRPTTNKVDAVVTHAGRALIA